MFPEFNYSKIIVAVYFTEMFVILGNNFGDKAAEYFAEALTVSF